MCNDCKECDYLERVGDGYGMCTKEVIPIMVINNYEPTEHYLMCQKCIENIANRVVSNMSYGQMSYQKDNFKTMYQMSKEGWCDDCLGDPNKCQEEGRCKGYENIN